MKTRAIQVRLSQELLSLLNSAADRNGLTRSAVIRVALREWLERDLEQQLDIFREELVSTPKKGARKE